MGLWINIHYLLTKCLLSQGSTIEEMHCFGTKEQINASCKLSFLSAIPPAVITRCCYPSRIATSDVSLQLLHKGTNAISHLFVFMTFLSRRGGWILEMQGPHVARYQLSRATFQRSRLQWLHNIIILSEIFLDSAASQSYSPVGKWQENKHFHTEAYDK